MGEFVVTLTVPRSVEERGLNNRAERPPLHTNEGLPFAYEVKLFVGR